MAERSTSERSEDASLLKVLGNWDALALGFGAMIGFGWVVLTGGWLDNAGTMGAVLAGLFNQAPAVVPLPSVPGVPGERLSELYESVQP